MHIGIVGPIATADVQHLLGGNANQLPLGYSGGPLLATLVGELIARGHTVSAFTLSNDLPLRKDGSVVASGPNFSLTYVPMRPRAWQFNGWLLGRILDLYRFEIDGLKHAILQANPDVLHAHWVYEFALASLQTKLPHVVTCHDSPYTIARLNSTSRPTRSLYRWLRVIMALKTFNRVQCITAVSPYMRDMVRSLTHVPIAVVPNPVDERAFGYANPRVTSISPRIAMVCNGWVAWKNPQPGLLAFSQLLQTMPLAELHLYGADFGPGQYAQTWCISKGIVKGMFFHGSIPHHLILNEMNNLDLLLHPSIEESFGVVIAEAMAMGLPVVAGRTSGAVPWLVGDDACLCDITDPSIITSSLLSTLEPERYADLSKRGIASMRRRFTTATVVDQFIRLYAQAIGRVGS